MLFVITWLTITNYITILGHSDFGGIIRNDLEFGGNWFPIGNTVSSFFKDIFSRALLLDPYNYQDLIFAFINSPPVREFINIFVSLLARSLIPDFLRIFAIPLPRIQLTYFNDCI